MESSLVNLFSEHKISLSPAEMLQFEKFLGAFMEYNSHTNLSAIRDAEGIVEKHFVDSLMLQNFFDISGMKVLDIGTGGGFPGIPLAIRVPSVQVTLLDSVGKKIKACDTFIETLGLTNCETVHARAEQISGNAGRRGAYDLGVSRATASMDIILEWMSPFIRKGGHIALYKTASEEEYKEGIIAARKLNFRLVHTFSYVLAERERFLYVFERK